MFSKIFQKKSAQRSMPSTSPPQDRSSLASPEASAAAQQREINPQSWSLKREDIEPRVSIHYGIPSTSSCLAFDPIQSLLAVGTLDGRIKVFGGDGIEGLLVSPKQLPFKYLQFLQSQGFLVSVTNENVIQVWDLEQRLITAAIQWESNLTAFCIIMGSSFMYIGDEFGMVYVLTYHSDDKNLEILPYYIPTDSIAEALGSSSLIQQPVVGLLLQPSCDGTRLLIAYQDGVIVLWDISEDKVMTLKRNSDIQIGATIIIDTVKSEHKLSDAKSESEQEKEISSLCWISSDGLILAVGYVDGEILLWNQWVSKSGTDPVSEFSTIKLQLSSSSRNLPVIVLNWSANIDRSNYSGKLFVYGGDAIGSEEVLTILSLDWSSGFEKLKCVSRVDLTLNGSFADMILLPTGETSGHTDVIVLTNPGQLHYYDESSLSSLVSHGGRCNYVSSVPYPMVIPTVEPFLSTSKFVSLKYGSFSRGFLKKLSGIRQSVTKAHGSWQLSGGVAFDISSMEDDQIERMYIAGYRDGSIRMLDATFPIYSPICVIEPEAKAGDDAMLSAPISAMEFCTVSLTLAVGNDLGMVRIYKLIGDGLGRSLSTLTDKNEEPILHTNDILQHASSFSILKSTVCTLCFAMFGARLAVGFKCCQVAMLDIRTSSVLFLLDSLQCLPVKLFPVEGDSLNEPSGSDASELEVDPEDKLMVVTSDANILIVTARNGVQTSSHKLQLQKNSVVTSVHCLALSSETFSSLNQKDGMKILNSCEDDAKSFEAISSNKSLERFLLVLCCANAFNLYSLKFHKEVEVNSIRSVEFQQICCWATTFQKNNNEYGLVALYESGLIEIRSLPSLEVVGETSLMKMLRWNFKNNMEKTLCSSHNAQIMMVNGCEFASISLLRCENDLRIPETLPCLFDKEIASAANRPSSPSALKKMQIDRSRILGGLMKGLKKKDVKRDIKPSLMNFAHLGTIFSSPPFMKSSMVSDDNEDAVELSIDDIDIDDPIEVSPIAESSSTSSTMKGVEAERQRLFEGASIDSQPKLRTAEEIRAKYRKEDPAAAASRARDKLVERQEKLERLSLRTQELLSGAEDFASMANELVKQMEKRKWWNI